MLEVVAIGRKNAGKDPDTEHLLNEDLEIDLVSLCDMTMLSIKIGHPLTKSKGIHFSAHSVNASIFRIFHCKIYAYTFSGFARE